MSLFLLITYSKNDRKKYAKYGKFWRKSCCYFSVRWIFNFLKVEWNLDHIKIILTSIMIFSIMLRINIVIFWFKVIVSKHVSLKKSIQMKFFGIAKKIYIFWPLIYARSLEWTTLLNSSFALKTENILQIGALGHRKI